MAAQFIAAGVSERVVGYIGGLSAPAGKAMDHAGVIMSGFIGGGQATIEIAIDILGA